MGKCVLNGFGKQVAGLAPWYFDKNVQKMLCVEPGPNRTGMGLDWNGSKKYWNGRNGKFVIL